MLDEDLRIRARRLMAGDHRVADLDRLLLGLRDRAGSQSCFREIGDFVAHRDTRSKGLVSQVGRDVFTSVDVWSLKLRGREPAWEDIVRATKANLRLATDEQLQDRCGCQKSSAKQRIQSAVRKIEAGKRLTPKEAQTLDFLGNSFIWKPAFTASQFTAEFTQLLLKTRIIESADCGLSEETRRFLVRYAITLMHGSAIILEDGARGQLFAGYSNRERYLEVKVEIVFRDMSKPLYMPICLFWTDLIPEENCSPTLLESFDPAFHSHWNFPLDLGPDGKLVRVG